MLEVIYKNLLILFITIFLILLGYTAYIFEYKQIDIDMIQLHKIVGILLVLLSILHLYTKRKKLKKLINEFIHIFTKEKVTLDSDMDLLIYSIENKSLEEIVHIFNMDLNELEEVFNKNNIVIESKSETLKSIAKKNSAKIFFSNSKNFRVKTKKITIE